MVVALQRTNSAQSHPLSTPAKNEIEIPLPQQHRLLASPRYLRSGASPPLNLASRRTMPAANRSSDPTSTKVLIGITVRNCQDETLGTGQRTLPST